MRRIEKQGRRLAGVLWPLLACGHALAARASAPPGLTLHALFNGLSSGVDRRGSEVLPRIAGQPRVVSTAPAVTAVQVGPVTGQIEYPSDGTLSPAEGTVEMWVTPLDWDSHDSSFHVFLDARGNGGLFLYKQADNSRLAIVATQDANAGPFYSDAVDIDWRPGTWHHLAATWAAEGLRLYIDGQPVSAGDAEARLPQTFASYFSVGDLPWSSRRTSSSLVRDLRIYDRALSPRRIALDYMGRFDTDLELGASGTALSYRILSAPGTCLAILRTDATRGVEDADVRFALVRAEHVESENLTHFDSRGLAQARLPLTLGAPGHYELRASILRSGGVILRLRATVEIPAMPAEIFPDRPQIPWSAPQVHGDTVAIWGRSYEFGDGALPRQMTSESAALLSQPIVIEASAAGRDVSLQALGRTVRQEAAQGRAVIEGRWVTTSGAQPIATVITTVAYDGLVTVNLDAERAALAAAGIDTLHLRVPLDARHVHYLYRSNGHGGSIVTGTDGRDGVIDATTFVPWYWVGDNDTGLFWFAETAADWPAFSRSDALQLTRNGTQLGLSLNLLEHPAEPRHVHLLFGLQATPVRPMRADRRHWRLQPGSDANIEVLWPTPTADSVMYYGYPRATDERQMRARVRRDSERGVSALPYVCVTCISTATPEWKIFGTGWSNGNFDATSVDVRAFGAALAFVAPQADGWLSFIASRVGGFVRQFGFHGLYLDNIRPYGAYAPEVGLGFRDGSGAWNSFPILGYREILRAVRGEVLKFDPDAVVIAHSSSELVPAMLAYADAYLDGEQFVGRVSDNYLDVLSLEQFRAEFMGRQWGIAPLFLPEFPTASAQQTAPTRALMSLLLVHDVGIWPLNCNLQEVSRALAPLQRRHYESARFVPYFAARPPAPVTPEGLYISSYETERDSIVVVANLTRQVRGGRVCLDAEVSARDTRALSLIDGTGLPIDSDGCFSTYVNAGDYQLLAIARPSAVRS